MQLPSLGLTACALMALLCPSSCTPCQTESCAHEPYDSEDGSLLQLPSTGSKATGAIVDLIVITGYRAACPEGYNQISAIPGSGLTGDVNQGAGGKYIWLCAKRGNQNPITDVLIVATHGSITDCNTNSGGWHRASQQLYSNGDLNQDVGGKYIYLCYRKDSSKPPVVDLHLTQDKCPDEEYRAQEWVWSNGNLNQDVGGKYIFLCVRHACIAKAVVGTWRGHGTIASPVNETWTRGTSKTFSQSSESAWSSSVTETVAAGFEFEGVGVAAEISGTMAQSVAETYSQDWSSSATHTFALQFGEKQVGLTAWQFEFQEVDTCDHRSKTLVMEFALTEGAWRPPCCLPGYATDAPAYKTCKTKESMVIDGEEHGCKVSR